MNDTNSTNEVIRKFIPGYEGQYSCDTEGNIYSEDRIVTDKRGFKKFHKGCKLKPKANSSGYLQVDLCRSFKTVHSLVMLAFIGERPEGYDVCHLDHDPLNNALSNLEYKTHAENCADSVKAGRSSRGEHRPAAKLTEAQVKRIRSEPLYHGLYQKLADELGVHLTTVRSCYLRQGWTHVKG